MLIPGDIQSTSSATSFEGSDSDVALEASDPARVSQSSDVTSGPAIGNANSLNRDPLDIIEHDLKRLSEQEEEIDEQGDQLGLSTFSGDSRWFDESDQNAKLVNAKLFGIYKSIMAIRKQLVSMRKESHSYVAQDETSTEFIQPHLDRIDYFLRATGRPSKFRKWRRSKMISLHHVPTHVDRQGTEEQSP